MQCENNHSCKTIFTNSTNSGFACRNRCMHVLNLYYVNAITLFTGRLKWYTKTSSFQEPPDGFLVIGANGQYGIADIHFHLVV